MKHNTILLSAYCCIIIMSHAIQAQSVVLSGQTFFSPRSQSTNAARDIVASHQFTHRVTTKPCYGTFSITPEYKHSYKNHQIAEYFFNTDTLTIAGSQITTKDANHILADYFGLSPAFQSTVYIKPVIQNALLDFYFYGGSKKWYFILHAPIVWTKWHINLYETLFETGTTTPFPARYMTDSSLNAPIQSFIEAMKGNTTFGDIQEGMAFGIINGPRKETTISDIHVALGYDFILRENGHLGFNIRMAAPTGTRPNGKYFFEAIVGNGKHWELGLGFSSHVIIWEKDGNKTISLYFDANATHLFKTRQIRSFDFKENGFGSRFILLKEFNDTGAYTGKSLPAINVTTLPCYVHTNFQLDMVVMFAFLFRNFDFDIGYNAWLRSKERIDLICGIKQQKYGFKGIQNVRNPDSSMSIITQSTATLNGDNFINQAADADLHSPKFISTCNLDLTSAASPTALTHKFFFNLSYTWNDTYHVKPYLGLGSEFEFEGLYRTDNQPNKNTLSQWGIWLKGGLGF